MRGAFLHVATDLLAFVGTALAGGLVLRDRLGPVRSDRRPASSLRSCSGPHSGYFGIRCESSSRSRPANIDPDEVGQAIVAEPEVVEVHDLHVWTLTSGFPVLSAHVLVPAGRRLPPG